MSDGVTGGRYGSDSAGDFLIPSIGCNSRSQRAEYSEVVLKQHLHPPGGRFGFLLAVRPEFPFLSRAEHSRVGEGWLAICLQQTVHVIGMTVRNCDNVDRFGRNAGGDQVQFELSNRSLRLIERA